MKIKRSKQHKKQPSRRMLNMTVRRYFVLGLFVLAASALIWRAVDQQIFEQDFLQNEANKRHLTTVELDAQRGLIKDRRGDVLAMTTPVASVVANPRRFFKKTSLQNQGLEEIAQAISIPVEHLRERLAQNRDRRFVYLRHGLPPAKAQRVLDIAKAKGINGIEVEKNVKRYYPAGEVFAHVLGFTDYQDIGQEGLERTYDEELRGKTGAKLVLRNGKREVIDEDIESIQLPSDGEDFILSLDGRLQHIAYRTLKSAVTRHSAIGGSVVLQDIQTGEVLVMVNQPSFNPNDGNSRTSEGGKIRNRALLDAFEPGSTLKPFIVAAALEYQYAEPHEVIDTRPGHIKVRSKTIVDKHNLGEIDLATLLSRSSNVGATKLALRMDKAIIWQILHDFDFGQLPFLHFPASTAGRLNHHYDWSPVDQATLAFGYGMAASALQLTNAYAALANDGVYVPATLLKRKQAPRGKRVISAKTSRIVRHLLQTVVAPGGTATQAAIPGYQVAGKTGTVRKFIDGAYHDDRYLALFAGFAPVQNPRLAMVVMLDEPRSQQYYGGQVAAPVFSRVMGESLRLLNIQPDGSRQAPVRLAQNTQVAE